MEEKEVNDNTLSDKGVNIIPGKMFQEKTQIEEERKKELEKEQEIENQQEMLQKKDEGIQEELQKQNIDKKHQDSDEIKLNEEPTETSSWGVKPKQIMNQNNNPSLDVFGESNNYISFINRDDLLYDTEDCEEEYITESDHNNQTTADDAKYERELSVGLNILKQFYLDMDEDNPNSANRIRNFKSPMVSLTPVENEMFTDGFQKEKMTPNKKTYLKDSCKTTFAGSFYSLNNYQKTPVYNMDLDYEYLRPPIYAMTLKKKDIMFKDYTINLRKIQEKQIYCDYNAYTEKDKSNLEFSQDKINKLNQSLSSFWNFAEIFRVVNSAVSSEDDSDVSILGGLYRGYSKLELIYLMDIWIKNLKWEVETLSEKGFLTNGSVNIIGRDITYNPVLYQNISEITKDNACDFACILSKVIVVARTYMCIPTKIETIWVILDTNYINCIDKIRYIHWALKPLEYIQSIVSKVVWVRPSNNSEKIVKIARKLGFITDLTMQKFDIVGNSNSVDYDKKLRNYFQNKIDLNYIPKWLGGLRKDIILKWPPEFTNLEYYPEILTIKKQANLGIKFFYFPLDKKKFEKYDIKITTDKYINSTKKNFLYSNLKDTDNEAQFQNRPFSTYGLDKFNGTIFNKISHFYVIDNPNNIIYNVDIKIKESKKVQELPIQPNKNLNCNKEKSEFHVKNNQDTSFINDYNPHNSKKPSFYKKLTSGLFSCCTDRKEL